MVGINEAVQVNVHDHLVIPGANLFLAPILLTFAALFIACHMRVARSIDPDLPRILSKTLTVDS